MKRWKRRKERAELVPAKRICVATPCGDTTHASYTASLLQMVMRTLGKEFPSNLGELMVQLYGSSILPFSRQLLVTQAIEQGFTHLLFIDSDMIVPSDLLLRWIQRSEPILAANCISRREPYRYTAQSAPGVQVPTGADSTGMQQVYRAGFGVIWLDLSIFSKIPEPWFEFLWIPADRVFKGEDYAFCEKAHAMGYTIWIDHDVSKEVKHVGTFEFSPLHRAKADLAMAAERAA